MADWHIGIGDPSVLGWATVVAYFGSAAIAFRAAGDAIQRPRPGRRVAAMVTARRFWLCLAFVLVALGINKQLDLQSLVAEIGRDVALAEGWYFRRRAVQRDFILGVCLAAGVAAGLLLVMLRKADRWVLLATVLMSSLVGFVLMRAASLHRIDAMLRADLLVFRVNHVIEIGLLALVAGTGWAARRSYLGR